MKKLHYKDVTLELLAYIDTVEGWSPYYIYSILIDEVDYEIGRIVFRLGDDIEHEFAGHVGYTVYDGYHGHHYAYQACKALIPLIQSHHYDHVLITCSSNNIASKKTIERLGGQYIETKIIPKEIRKDFAVDETEKRIYKWELNNPLK